MAALRELDHRLAPLRRAVEVGEAVADDERRAARVTACERIAGLAAERDRHRLVEQRDPLIDLPLAHERATELSERHAFDVRVAGRVREVERGPGVALGVCQVVGALCLLDREPSELDTRADVREQAPGARDPARRLGVPAVDACSPAR